jgi:hypothetical protein
MLRRTIFWSLTIISGAISFVSDFGGAIVMGSSKDQIVDAYEQAGVDVSACKERGRSIVDPSGGMPECLEGSFKDIASKLEDAGGDSGPSEAGAADAVGEPELE